MRFRNTATAVHKIDLHLVLTGLVLTLIDIVEKYPKWGIWFGDRKTSVDVKLKALADENERSFQTEIVDKIRVAIAKRNKLPGVKGVSDAIDLTVGEHEVEQSDE